MRSRPSYHRGAPMCWPQSRSGHVDRTLAGLQIRGIEIRIALPKERRFTHVVAWRQGLRIFPTTAKADMVLEVLPNARKVLHARYSQPLQFGLVTDSGQHQHLWRMDRAQR